MSIRAVSKRRNGLIRGQHFKTDRVVDLDGMKATIKARIKALAAKLPLLADLLPQAAPVDVRAAVQERQRRADAGWATLAEVDAVLASATTPMAVLNQVQR